MSGYVQTVAVDFDSVIHAYSKGWQDGSIYDPPMPGALEGLRKLAAVAYIDDRGIRFESWEQSMAELAARYPAR